MRRIVAGAVALVLLASACEMRAEISVEEDGSGTFGFVFLMEAMVFGTMPGDMDPLQQARRQLSQDGLPWRIEPYSELGLKGFRATLPFDSVEHLLQMMQESAGGPIAADDGSFVLQRDGEGGWTFRARGDASAADFGMPFDEPAGDFPAELGAAPELPQLPESINDILRVEVHVTLPGDAAVHNAGEVDEHDGRSTFVWRLNVTDPDARALEAATTPASGGLPVVPVALLLIVLGGGWFFLRRRGLSFGGGTPPVVLEGLPPIRSPSGVEGVAPVTSLVPPTPAARDPA